MSVRITWKILAMLQCTKKQYFLFEIIKNDKTTFGATRDKEDPPKPIIFSDHLGNIELRFTSKWATRLDGTTMRRKYMENSS